MGLGTPGSVQEWEVSSLLKLGVRLPKTRLSRKVKYYLHRRKDRRCDRRSDKRQKIWLKIK